jgi:hypothetical protein
MTSSLATRAQAWFTSRMPTTRTRAENIYEKAERIADDPARTIASPNSDAPHWWTGKVVGDHGTYSAFAVSPEMKDRLELGATRGRIGCFCPAGVRGKLCSHAIVAEEMRRRGES